MTSAGRAAEFARLALAASCFVNAESRAASRSSSVLAAIAGARHALQAGIVLVFDRPAVHRVARTVDGIHVVSMALLWMASPFYGRFAGRQFLGTLGMMALESLVSGRRARR